MRPMTSNEEKYTSQSAHASKDLNTDLKTAIEHQSTNDIKVPDTTDRALDDGYSMGQQSLEEKAQQVQEAERRVEELKREIARLDTKRDEKAQRVRRSRHDREDSRDRDDY